MLNHIGYGLTHKELEGVEEMLMSEFRVIRMTSNVFTHLGITVAKEICVVSKKQNQKTSRQA